MEEMGPVRKGYSVRGRVQGVGFRWWTRETCARLGIGGHVRNMPDGTVEVQVAGPSDRLAELERLLWEGPPPARVDDVRVIDHDERAQPDRFETEWW